MSLNQSYENSNMKNPEDLEEHINVLYKEMSIILLLV